MEENESSSIAPQELRNKIEAILFASGKKVDVYFIKDILGIDNVRKIKNALEAIKKSYDENSNVLMINQEGDLWKMNVRENYSDVVRKLISETDLPKSVLETLSVIAWKSPVYQSEIVDIRGASAYEHIALLVDTGFVTKEKQARSFILKVTNKFFEYFDIEGNEGIKEVFKKIKEKPEQTKVSEFENKEAVPQEGAPQEAIIQENPIQEALPEGEAKKIGEFDVIDIEDKGPSEKIEEDSETLGKLEVYEEKENDGEFIGKGRLADDIPDFGKDNDEESTEESEEFSDEDIKKEKDVSKRAKEIVKELLDDEDQEDKS